MLVTLNVVALVQEDATADQLTEALARVQGIHLGIRHVATGERPRNQLASDEQPDIILLELGGNEAEDLHEVEQILHQTGGRVVVFVICGQSDSFTVRRMLGLGVRRVYARPLEVQGLVLDVIECMSEKRSRVQRARSHKGALTAFVNAKGGSGATTLATNVACTLAARHKHKVALIDLDVQFGAAALGLDLRVGSDITNALFQPERIDPLFLQALMIEHASGLHVLPAPGDLTEVDTIRPGATSALLQAALDLYEVVIVDVPRLFVPWTLEALRMAHPVLLVSQKSLVTIRDTKLLLERLPLNGVPREQIEVVNNRAQSRIASLDIQAMKRTLKLECIHRITNDYATAVAAQDRGVPVDQVNRRSAMTQDIERLAAYLHSSLSGEQVRSPGLWDRLFRRRA
ncbi:AAA family ATPase [Halorhodospira halophila]|uniref:AAA family ATPase n=1 Tax=Halorhodospira halophila TaxID=1053 RepID=UPI0019140763|nr:AAA family ATPase [Halorhodospira halophila]MBK5937150.1 hypothetical protein [Halorhodospira halophila]